MAAAKLAVTTGEPAGIGPEIALSVAARYRRARLVLIGDLELLRSRAPPGLGVTLVPFSSTSSAQAEGIVEVLHVPLAVASNAGVVDPANARYVLNTLDEAVNRCLRGELQGVVTAPVHKAVINDAGIPFTGHTEYLAELSSGVPVMMLAAPELRVALVTTHLPLSCVPSAITEARVVEVLRIVERDLRLRFGIARPRIQVCGLNPHAGEGGHLGLEDDAQIAPAVAALAQEGIAIDGPWPADTAFVPERRVRYDVTVAMYHDQGLPVLKALGFGEAVNITLGLGVIRTSVDHGTALDIAGQGIANDHSLEVAVDLATDLVLKSQLDKVSVNS